MKTRNIALMTYDWNNEVTAAYFRGVERFLKDHPEARVTVVEGFGYYGAQEAEEAAFQVFNLPHIWDYDGVIIQGNRVWSEQYKQRIVDRARENDVPAISLNYPLGGAINVTTDNRGAERVLTEHVLQKGARRLAFVRGNANSQEARDREQGFLDACAAAGIRQENIRLLDGSWEAKDGVRAVQTLLAEGELPDALICCNDDLAVGALGELEKRGVQVPEQVMLTGFDNLLIAQCARQRITTIDRDYEQTAVTAMQTMWESLDGGFPGESTVFSPARPVFSMSTGDPCSAEDLDLLRQRQMNAHDYSRIYYQLSYNMGTAMERASSLEEVLDIFEQDFPKTGIDGACLVLNELYRDNLADAESVRHYGEQMLLMGVARREGEAAVQEPDEEHLYEAFPRAQLLPEKYRSGAQMILLYPLRYEEICQGYVVLRSLSPLMDFHYLECLLQVISDAIEMVRSRTIMQRINEELSDSAMTDPLTGLCNRLGFNKYGVRYARTQKKEGKDLYLTFMNMDELGRINQDYGREGGDLALKAAASVVERVAADAHGFAMRYGADAFLVLSGESVEQALRQGFAGLQSEGKTAFPVSFSIGESVLSAGERISLQRAVDRADDVMFDEKRAKRAQRAKS